MIQTEIHPWQPFIPGGAEILFAGTFPPTVNRWSMSFYYPNPANDFWRIMGLVFYNDKDIFWIPDEKRFDLSKIKEFLTEHHIAMSDTAREVRRLKGNASDKFLEIVTPIDLENIRLKAPNLKAIVTTGEKAAGVIAEITGTVAPKMGEYTPYDGLRLWRMPSTSRAFPMPLAKKAEYYKKIWD